MKFLVSVLFVLPAVAHAGAGDFKAPTLHAYLAVVASHYSQAELDAVTQFCVKHKIDLNKRLNVNLKGERAFLAGQEIKVDAKAKTIQYRGHYFKPAGKKLEALVDEVNREFDMKAASRFSLLPEAYADASLGGGVVMLATAVAEVDRARDGSFLAQQMSFAGILSGLGGWLKSGFGFVGQAKGDDTSYFTAATCDASGVTMTMNGHLMVYTVGPYNQLKCTVDGTDVDIVLTGQAASAPDMVKLIQSCKDNPKDPVEYVNALNNMINEKLSAQSRAAGTGNSGGADAPDTAN